MVSPIKSGLTFKKAFKRVFIVECLSIVVMEGAEVLTEIYTLSVMQAELTSWVF